MCAPFATARTYDATNNASVLCSLALRPGDVVDISNCATAAGDTFTRLFSPDEEEAIYNDDGCGLTSYGSRFVYTVPCSASGNAGPWRLAQVGCRVSRPNNCSRLRLISRAHACPSAARRAASG